MLATRTQASGVTTLAGQGRHLAYGPFTFEGALAKDGPRATLVLANPLPAASLKDVRLALSPEGDSFRIETTGDSRLGPFSGRILLTAPKDGPARLGIGAGIVQDSRAVEEFEECRLKARFLTGLPPGFELDKFPFGVSGLGLVRALLEQPLDPSLVDHEHFVFLARGWMLGIATGKSDRGLAHMLATHGLTPAFATLQTADRHPSKPHPSMIHTAMRDAGAAPEYTAMIGDTQIPEIVPWLFLDGLDEAQDLTATAAWLEALGKDSAWANAVIVVLSRTSGRCSAVFMRRASI